MIDSQNYVSRPIHLSEVANLLGCKSDVGTVCTSPMINKWARHKPVNLDKIFNLDDLDGYLEENFPNQRARFGLKISESYMEYVAPSSCISGNFANLNNATSSFAYKLAKGTLDDWKYVRPVKNQSWFRLGDFDGYWHNAPSPLPTISSAVQNLDYSTSPIRDVNFNSPVDSDDARSLHLKDFIISTAGDLSNYYIGVLFYNNDLTKCFWLTNTSKVISEGGSPIRTSSVVLKDIGATGEWNARLFLSKQQLGFNENPVTSVGNYSFLVGCDPDNVGHVTITSGSNNGYMLSIVSCEVIAGSNPARIKLSINITNNSASSVTVTKITAKNVDDFSSSEVTIYSGSTSIAAAGGQYNFQKTDLTELQINPNKKVIVTATIGSKSYTVDTDNPSVIVK